MGIWFQTDEILCRPELWAAKPGTDRNGQGKPGNQTVQQSVLVSPVQPVRMVAGIVLEMRCLEEENAWTSLDWLLTYDKEEQDSIPLSRNANKWKHGT